MRIGCLGISYRSTTDFQLRERVARAAQSCFSEEAAIIEHYSAILLTTCNRMEIYFCAPDPAEAQSALLQLLREKIAEPFEHELYSYFGQDCFAHLLEVASGLDSAILAETEVQRQVKMAYANGCLDRILAPEMHYLFQKGLKTSKEVRNAFPLFQGQPTLENILLRAVEHFFGCLEELAVLFIGNSEINRKILALFQRKKVKEIALCTRSEHNAKELFKDQGIRILNWQQLSLWPQYPLVICATNQQNYLLSPQQIFSTLKTRLLIDLAVPRNIDPLLGKHPQIALLKTTDLEQLNNKKTLEIIQEREKAIEEIRSVAERQVALFQEKQQRVLECV